MGCDCLYHRYPIVHTILGDDRVYDHSQATMESLQQVERDTPGDVRSYPSSVYEHGMDADALHRAWLSDTRAVLLSTMQTIAERCQAGAGALEQIEQLARRSITIAKAPGMNGPGNRV